MNRSAISAPVHLQMSLLFVFYVPNRTSATESLYSTPFVAQNIFAILSTDSTSFLAASISTFCLLEDASLVVSQIVECRSGYFSRCSGLK